MWKLCKKCWKVNENPLLKLCREHYYEEQLNNPKQLKFKKIKQVSTKNKNTPAKFSQKTKDEILDRDKVCIITWDPITDYHHVYYWANANRSENRNDLDQWVWLSSEPHRIIHHASPKESVLAKIYRARCIEYILTLK